MEAELGKIAERVVQLDLEGVKALTQKLLTVGVAPYRMVSEGLSEGMEKVGLKYEKGEYFLAELMMAAAVMKEAMKILEPYLKMEETKKEGKVVIGTVRGDLHDVGKNIFISLLQGAGFEVTDLGVDVPSERFVKAVSQYRPDILGMSALITTTMEEMGIVIQALEDVGLRKTVKVILGGTPITPEFGEEVGADAAVNDAMEGLRICRMWVKKGRKVASGQ